MWLEWLEGFDWAGSSAEVQDRYEDGSWILQVGAGRGGGNCANDPDYTYYVFSSDGQTEVLMGVAYRPAALIASNILEWRKLAQAQLAIALTIEGRLTFKRGSTVIDTSALTMTADDWHFIDVQFKIDNAVGLYNVWVDGILWMEATGVDTEQFTGGIGNVKWPTHNAKWDDMHLYLGAGASNATRVGDSKVPAVLVNAAGDDAQWSPSAGANYENVDDPIADEDATYNQDGVIGQRDLYNFADLAAFTGSIKGVEVLGRFRKTDVGDKQAKIACKSGGTVYYGGNVAILDTYALFHKAWEVDPFTSAEWTRTSFNAAQFGAEVVL